LLTCVLQIRDLEQAGAAGTLAGKGAAGKRGSVTAKVSVIFSLNTFLMGNLQDHWGH